MDEKKMASRFDAAAVCLGAIGRTLLQLPDQIKAAAHEIRLRVNRPVTLSLARGDLFITDSGTPACTLRGGLLYAESRNIEEAFRIICESSVHSHQQEIKNGFVTLRGGHRAGICGTAVVCDGKIENIRDISSINLRVAREIKGCADETLETVFSQGKIEGAILVGPPGCGKTTVLRDLARQISCGKYGFHRVAIVDERGEIAATFHGNPQNDLGPCCDVLDGYPKGEGILQAVRCLAPDVVICDEIGSEDDARAVEASLNAGVSVIASAHALNMKELYSRPQFQKILNCGAFKKAILLKGRESPGKIKSVYGEGELNAFKADRTDSGVYMLRSRRFFQIRDA